MNRSIGVVLGCLLTITALASGADAQPRRRLPSPIKRTPIAVKPPPKPPKLTIPRLPRVLPGSASKRFEVTVGDGANQVRVAVTLTAPKHVDARVLDYLEKTLRVVP